MTNDRDILELMTDGGPGRRWAFKELIIMMDLNFRLLKWVNIYTKRLVIIQDDNFVGFKPLFCPPPFGL